MMSIKLMSKIWEHPELARGQTIVTKDKREVDQQNKLRTMKIVLLCLADMANDDGVCWPSNKTIAERANLTPDYVRSLIGTLKANDWLVTTERFSETGKQTSNWINLNTDKIHTLRLSTPPRLSTPLPRGIKSTPYPPHLVGGTIEPSLETKEEPSIKPIDSLPPLPVRTPIAPPTEKARPTPPVAPYPSLAEMGTIGTARQWATQRGKAQKYCQDYNWRIHRDIFEAAVDAMGKRALVDADNDRTIGDLQQAAVTLGKAGLTAESITNKAPGWKASYFGQRNGGVQQFIDFMATEAPAATPAQGKTANVVNLFTLLENSNQ